MQQLKNSVAMVTLVAMAAALSPPAMSQDQPAAEPSGTLESLVDSASGDPAGAEDEPPVPEVELLADAELDELVAPVALYPDALLAQVLVASTYPLQVVKADRVIQASEGLTDQELSETLSEQDLDPSVLVLLSGFPTVIERMAEDLEWTEDLGMAMLRQDDDVLAAVQRMRTEARDMGYLDSNDAQTVEETDGQIYLAPADPEIVYVPTYDPGVVYTSPAPAEPYYVAPAQGPGPLSPGNLITTGVVAFGTALLVNELWGDDDDDGDDWDGYWTRQRPIDWREREFYPRPYWSRGQAASARAWSWERDHYWRRADNGWRREAARDRREAALDRREALGAMGRDPARVRAARESGQWRAIERDRRERAAQRARAERREERQQAAERDERRKAREDAQREERRDQRQQATQREERQKAREAAEREERQKARAAARRQEARGERQQAAEREERRKAREAQRATADRPDRTPRDRAAPQPERGTSAEQSSGRRAAQGDATKPRKEGQRQQQAGGHDGKARQRCRDDDKDCK